MKTIVLYYSFGGQTKKYAEKLALAHHAIPVEVKEAKKRSIFSAFFRGCPAAMQQKKVALAGAVPDLMEYDTIVLAAPLWAGFPAPAFNSMVDYLPAGKQVEIHLVSGGGDSSKSREKVISLIQQAGCEVSAYQDIKAEK